MDAVHASKPTFGPYRSLPRRKRTDFRAMFEHAALLFLADLDSAAWPHGCSSRPKPAAERIRSQALAVKGPESSSRSASWRARRPR